jgi:hypothetical protein
MTTDLFDEPRAKLVRARKHLDELTAAEAAFNATNPIVVETGIDEDGNPALLLRAVRFPDLQCSAIAGDVLNNLRASLDLTVNAACRVNGRTNLSKTYFPIMLSEDDWPDMTSGKGNRMKAASPAIKKLVKSYKPWKSGNPILHALSRLVGLDKHQAIIALAAQQQGMTLERLKLSRRDGEKGLVPVRARAHLRMTPHKPSAVHMSTDPEFEISVGGPNKISVVFGFEATDLQPYVGAIQLLHAMGGICEEIVETFADASAKGELA